jgi:hypothetical protein
MKRFLPILIAAGTLMGCSTELDINAPYKDITVVYGLLNMRDSVQFIKINKAFLGEGNAFDYAQIPDSNEYGEGDITYAKIFRKQNGIRVDSFPLRDTVLGNRLPGTFYGPEQRFYYFVENQTFSLPQSQIQVYLQQDSDYEMEVEVRGQRLRAETPIVNDFSIFATVQEPNVEVNLMSPTGGSYGSYQVRWTSSRDCKRFEVSYRFNFLEIRGQDTLRKAVTQRVGTRVTQNSQNPEQMGLFIDGELFFSTIATVVPFDATVDKRLFTGLDFLISVANDDFHTFLTLSEPISGIVEDRPEFTNVENGLGIFAGRYTKNVIGKRLNPATMNELYNGPYTGNRRFCSIFGGGPAYCD